MATATIASEVTALTDDKLEEPPLEVDEDQGENDRDTDAEDAAPITPPPALINTAPLNPPTDIADPVSGSGNPALLGPMLSSDQGGDQ
ncbi:hypothetical protein [Qipengyuania sp.]|uniref:hypothetical protein n=1 Tax=Qipengyuania sp. TaxID=2004515 RepID=UPI0035C7DD0D